MRIIDQPRAPNPRRVRIFLAEKGIEVPFEAIDIMKHEHKAPGFARLNPFQQVPVLVLDDGMAISESVAICRYFEEIQPEPPLMGETPLEQARIEMWNRRVELGLFHAVANCFRHTHPAMAPLEDPQIASWGEVNRNRALDFLGLLDSELRNSDYIAGGGYSIADITALVAVDFMKPAKIDRPQGLAGLDRWYDRVNARPSARA